MDISKKVVLFLAVFLLLAVPNFAIPHYGTDYVTPKLGCSLSGQYYYTNDYVDWYWATPSFESNGGYYNIYEIGDKVNFQITINTTKSGILYLMVLYTGEDGFEGMQSYTVKDLSSYNNVRAEKDVTFTDSMRGNIRYIWGLKSGGNWYYSKIYQLFLKKSLNSDWKYTRTIDITSTEKLKQGIVQITLNDTDFYENSNIRYAENTDTYNYAGTLSDLVFTNINQTKAYPYFINKYKGGYYNYSRESSNDTKIDLWVNEDLNDIDLRMFYGYDIGSAYKYLYGNVGSDYWSVKDEPNNPFSLHQIFSDWRWSKEQAIDLFNITGESPIIYNRGQNFELAHDKDPSTTILNLFPTQTNSVYIQTSIRRSYYDNMLIIKDTNNSYIYKIDAQYHGNNFSLYNSTGSSVDDFSDVNRDNFTTKLYFNGTQRQAILTEEAINLSINDTENFNIKNFHLQQSEYMRVAINYFVELADNSISFTIGEQKTTKYPTIQFSSMYEYDTFINDLRIGGSLSVDAAGTFLCKDINGTVLGAKEINTTASKTYDIVFPYTLTNETDFLNRTDFNYTCKFILDTGLSQESDNLTITFSNTTRIFINHTKPVNKKQLYNGTTKIPFETQFKFYNYTANQTYDIYYIYTGKNKNENILFSDTTLHNHFNLTDDYNFTETIDLNEDVNFTGTKYVRVNWYYRIYAYNDYYGNGTFQTSDTGYRYYDIGERPGAEEINEQTDWLNIYDNDDYEPYGNFVLVGGYAETQDIELTSELYCYDWTNHKMIFTHELGRESSETGDVQQIQDLGNDKYAIAFTYVYDIPNISESELEYYCCIYTTRDNLFCSGIATYNIPTDKLIITDRKPAKEQRFFTNNINVKATFTPTFDTYSNYSFLVVVGNEYMNFENYAFYLSKRINETDITFLQYLYKLIIDDTYSNEDFIRDTGVIYSWIGNYNDTYYFNENYTDVCSGDCKRQYIIFYWFNNQTISAVPVWNYFINYEGGGAGYIVIPDVRTYVHENLTDEETNSLFWGNPLSFLSSFTYVNFVVPTNDETVSGIFYWVFMIFWNFLFILLMIAIATYIKVQNLPLTLGVVLVGSLFFGYVGWISIPVTTILLLVVAGVGLYLKKVG